MISRLQFTHTGLAALTLRCLAIADRPACRAAIRLKQLAVAFWLEAAMQRRRSSHQREQSTRGGKLGGWRRSDVQPTFDAPTPTVPNGSGNVLPWRECKHSQQARWQRLRRATRLGQWAV